MRKSLNIYEVNNISNKLFIENLNAHYCSLHFTSKACSFLVIKQNGATGPELLYINVSLTCLNGVC
jgi:hypothetical protein